MSDDALATSTQATSLPARHLFSITANLGRAVRIPGGPSGSRVIVAVTGGTFSGERLSGKVADEPGGDWVTQREDGSIKLDVRICLETDDGASIFVTYFGIAVPGEDGLSIRTAPLFETGDERYRWLNSIQAVGIGTSSGGTVRYEVYELL